MLTTPEPRIRIGIGGWNYAPWRGSFYPKGLPQARELEYASRNLTSIEINATYYRNQKPESFARWRDATPEDFVFAVKAPRFVTNRRALSEAGESIERFFAGGVMQLGEKLGPINWQFMRTKRFEPEDFQEFLELLPRSIDGQPLRHAVEVRHESFQTPDFIDLARSYEVAIVTAGDSDYPQIADATAPFLYIRLMGSSETEPEGYSATSLERWATRARLWADGDAPEGLETFGPPHTTQERGREVFLYVISGAKRRNPAAATALIERLR